MKYYLRVFGKLFGGVAILIASFFPLIVGAAFFLGGCDFQEWAALFTDPDGLPMSEGIMIAMMALVTLVFLLTCMYGFWLTISASQHSTEDYGKMVLDAMKKHTEERQEQCPHDFVHQVGFTNMLKCDECGMTFENKHFVSE